MMDLRHKKDTERKLCLQYTLFVVAFRNQYTIYKLFLICLYINFIEVLI